LTLSEAAAAIAALRVIELAKMLCGAGEQTVRHNIMKVSKTPGVMNNLFDLCIVASFYILFDTKIIYHLLFLKNIFKPVAGQVKFDKDSLWDELNIAKKGVVCQEGIRGKNKKNRPENQQVSMEASRAKPVPSFGEKSAGESVLSCICCCIPSAMLNVWKFSL